MRREKLFLRGGHVFEENVANEFLDLSYTVIVDRHLDLYQNVDLILPAYRERHIIPEIEVQITLNSEDPDKLKRFIRIMKKRTNGRVKVYMVVKNLISAADAVKCAHFLFRRDLFHRAAPNEIRMLRIADPTMGEWLDINQQLSLLRLQFDWWLNSPDRLRGTISWFTSGNRACVITNCRRRYLAFYTEIADRNFAQRVERGEVKPGTPVTFYPTTETSTGPHYLARCVLPA